MKVKLKDICEIQSGGTPNRSNKQYWDNGTINWAKISDIKDKYLFNTEEKITEEGLKNSSAKLFKKNSILYTIFATLGEACILGIDTTTNQAIANLEIRDKNVETEYIYYYLLSKKKLISGIGRGVAQNNINLSILKEMEINLADITTQKRIVDILNQNESIINKYKKQIALLDTLIKARFVEMFGDEKITGIFEDYVEISRGASPRPIASYITEEKDGINWIKIGDVTPNDIYIKKTDEKIKKEGADKSRYVKKGDFVLSNSMSFGRPYILNIDGCVHDGWLIISHYNNNYEPIFLYYLIRSDEVQHQFRTSVEGAIVSNLNSDIVRNVRVILPDKSKQKKFVNFAEHIDKLKVA